MKKIILFVGMLAATLIFGQNKLLNQEFWKSKPTVEMVQAEIAAGNSPSEANSGQFDAVTLAINNGAPLESIVYLIRQKGNSVHKITHDGRIYLHWAALRDNAPLVEYLLKAGSDMKLEDTGGRTSFEFGAAGMSRETLEKFLAAGLPLSYRDENGANLLMLTAGKDTAALPLTKYLIQKGLDPQARDNQGRTFADYAARLGNVDLMKTLSNQNYPVTDQAVLLAAQGMRMANPLDLFVYLVDNLKLNPAAVDSSGKNALHHLVGKENSGEQIKYFLGKMVPISQKDKDGNTVLHFAAKSRNPQNLMTLLSLPELKEIIRQDNTARVMPLLLAAQYSSVEGLEAISALGGDLNTKDAKGNSLLTYILESYHERNKESLAQIQGKLDFLKRQQYDFSVTDGTGNTLLHLAAMKDNPELMKLALAFKPDQINARNENGNTPLMEAAAVTKNLGVLKVLLEAGADKSVKNSFEETAFSIASENELLQKVQADLSFLK